MPVQTGKRLTSTEYAEVTTMVCTKNMSLRLAEKQNERITGNLACWAKSLTFGIEETAVYMWE